MTTALIVGAALAMGMAFAAELTENAGERWLAAVAEIKRMWQ